MAKKKEKSVMPPLTKEAEYYVLKRLQESPDRRWTLMRGGRALFSVVVSVLHLLVLVLAFIMLCLSVFNEIYVKKKVNLFHGLHINKTMAFFIVLCVLLILVHGCASGFFYKLKSCTEFNNNWFRGLKMYLIAVIVMFLIVITGIFLCFMLSEDMEKQLHHSIFDAMKEYKYNQKIKTKIDVMQQKYRCCGSISARDWSSVSWISNTLLDSSKEQVKINFDKNEYYPNGVPYSCCSLTAKPPCIHILSKSSDFFKDMNIYKHGCSQKLLDYFDVIFLLPVGILLIVTAMIEIAILTLTRILQTSVKSAHLLGDDNGVGYAHLMPDILQDVWYDDS